MIVHALFAATLSLGTAAIQDVPVTQTAAQDAIVVTGEANKKNKRVCKRSVATGSIMAKSTCKTAGEWEAEKIRNETAAEKLRMNQRFAEQERLEKMLAQ